MEGPIKIAPLRPYSHRPQHGALVSGGRQVGRREDGGIARVQPYDNKPETVIKKVRKKSELVISLYPASVSVGGAAITSFGS